MDQKRTGMTMIVRGKNVLRYTGRQGKLPPIDTGTLEMKANNQGKGNYEHFENQHKETKAVT